MKLFKLKYVFFSFVAGLVFNYSMQAQVGIGTATPEGILDVESTTQGIIFPRVVLTSTILEAPVVNPNGVSLVAGTTVYNTTASNNGVDDVYPGIYSWNSSRWTPQFILEDYEKFEQTGGCMRTIIREGNSDPNPLDDADLPGLASRTFTPTYSGTYRIELKANFGAGAIEDFTSLDEISLATMEGAFFFKLSGMGVDINPDPVFYDYSEGWLYCHSYSTFNSIESPDLEDNTVPHYASLVYYEYLSANTPYTFTVSNCIITGNNYFVNNGDSGAGRGHIGHTIPCTVEFTFLKE
ncbi:MAG: hypothetical protein JKY22_03455 [Flavobacteriaceae bacterium]|nr:hypothetical protein [Flavobacteriaceae bacterium]